MYMGPALDINGGRDLNYEAHHELLSDLALKTLYCLKIDIPLKYWSLNVYVLLYVFLIVDSKLT